ncbi:hypothetical protein FZI24_17935 [Cronobacter sakazakii]|uniref:hypothetical protein n=1 Tax=Cronobacter sakazakii TaxID=28141 RepID=UPI000CF05B04|nr:hypothetical protein [Cronobacter sakazakii]ELQ8331609.1 hypothetical protein [Klebsiella oxytoca]ELY4780944.1 hypothetical protein [Cronobacter sakazakii]KAB0815089.1 hypothetical protein FZI24_17935 [Cronobacter sakazakii]PPY06490.1 hypothetical protein C3D67_10925 [Cronobacter sakazakii]
MENIVIRFLQNGIRYSDRAALIFIFLRMQLKHGDKVNIRNSSSIMEAIYNERRNYNYKPLFGDFDEMLKGLSSEFKRIKKEIVDIHLPWIKDNERACCWLWLYISREGMNEVDSQINNYIMLGFTDSCTNHKERYNAIIDFFCISHEIYNGATKIIDNVKKEWMNIQFPTLSLTWLNEKNSLQTDWAVNYLSAKDKRFNALRMLVGPDDNYLSVCAYFDTWERNNIGSPSDKKLLLSEINRAWNQKKSRLQRENKKSLNVVIDAETKEHLKIMADEKNENINKYIESLIIAAWDNRVHKLR